jgi:class 3 adenylate cyclase
VARTSTEGDHGRNGRVVAHDDAEPMLGSTLAMPLFMDRHDLPGVSAADIAQAHSRDLELEGKYDVKFLAYWFDAESGAVFCLARAPAAEAMAAVHRESHGLVPNEIIRVSEDAVLRFLGKVHDPADDSQVTSAFRTILFTDLEGSTALAERLEAAEFVSLLTEHDVIIRRALVAFRGREIKHTGDGVMASFDDAANALDAALAIQAGFRARNDERRAQTLCVRIGLAAGEPVDHNDDLFGATVNLASRLCSAADPGTVLVSDVVRELGSESGFAFAEVDRRVLKGFASPISAFRVIGREDPVDHARATQGAQTRPRQ